MHAMTGLARPDVDLSMRTNPPGWRRVINPWPQDLPQRREQQLLTIRMGFARHGGLVSLDEVFRRSLARWNIRGLAESPEIVRITQAGRMFLPLVQFDPADWSLCPRINGVLRELAPVFDDHEIALWFVEPNSWLRHAVPIDVSQSNPAYVLEAARADRFIARG